MVTARSKSPSSNALQSIGEFASAGQGGRALASAAEAWVSAGSECQREMIDFMAKRLEKDGETVREMMGCKTLGDMAAIQSRWFEQTLRDYDAEMIKLMSICTKSADIARLRSS